MDSEDKFLTTGKNKDWGDEGVLFALLKLAEVPNKKRLALPFLKQNGLNGAPQGATILSQKKFESLLVYIEETSAQPGGKVKKGNRSSFRFSMVGLKKDDSITFDPTGVQAIIFGDDKTILYNGNRYSLSGFCKKYLPERMRTKSNAYCGPKYFSHNGKTLWKIRLEKEKE